MESVDYVKTFNANSAHHYMIDIETLSLNRHKAVILSLAILPFYGDGGQGVKVCLPIIPQIEGLGRVTDQGTIAWWNQRPQKVLDAQLMALPETYNGVKEIREALVKIFAVVDITHGSRSYVWAKDPDFDLTNIENLAKSVALVVPWRFNQTRSVRTALDVIGDKADEIWATFDPDTAHDPMVDCRIQAQQVAHFFRVMEQKELC